MKRRGFTLIEVLATMVLLAIVLPVAMRGVSVSLAAASSAQHRAEAASLGEAKLNSMVATGEWSNTAPSGDFGADWSGYQWTLQTQARDFNTTEVMLTVTWTERGTQRSLPISTLVADTSNTSGSFLNF
jgi:prepilin-type N-terminal cleavage/methylation domain-containing protein